MKKFLINSMWMFIIAIIIVVLDQFTKNLVQTNIAYGGMWSPWEWLTPFARIVHWNNTGVAFGLFQGMNTVFMVLAVIVSLGIIYYFNSIPKQDWLIRLALTLELGGAVGNLIDRIRFGHVIDFISVGRFPVFNIADSCVTVGVVILLLGVWVQERREKKAKLSDNIEPELLPNETNE